MIAKLVVHGPTRAVALRQLARALAETEVAGTVTNLAFLGALARHEGFARGEVDTGLIERDLAALTATDPPRLRVRAVAALAAAGLWGGAAIHTGFTLWAPLRRRIELRHHGEAVSAMLICEGPDAARIEVEGALVLAERRTGGWWIDGAKGPARVEMLPGQVVVFEGAAHVFDIPDLLARDAEASAGADVTLSPMPGLVKAVLVAAGQAVAKGDRLAVLEAMKMEHTLVAARDGVVAEVLVAPGAQVEAGAALVRLEAAP
jgi:3-methylcrotonyl-CoA carboxylase alpha subunit